MTKYTTEVLAALTVAFTADPKSVSKVGKAALVAAGMVTVPTDARGRKAESVGALLLRFVSGQEVSDFLVKRLVDAGFVTVTGQEKVTPGAGRPANVYGLTGKGRSRAAIVKANAEKAARKAAEKAAAVA